jgi:hypothetical protein
VQNPIKEQHPITSSEDSHPMSGRLSAGTLFRRRLIPIASVHSAQVIAAARQRAC